MDLRELRSPRRAATVGEIMRRNFITVPAGEPVESARSIMRLARLRHLLVAQDGALLGMVSYRDLQDSALSRSSGARSTPNSSTDGAVIAETMVKAPYVVSPETSLSAAASRICGLGIGCLPVVETGEDGVRILGMITESDLLRAAYLS